MISNFGSDLHAERGLPRDAQLDFPLSRRLSFFHRNTPHLRTVNNYRIIDLSRFVISLLFIENFFA